MSPSRSSSATSLIPYYARLAKQAGFSVAKGVALPFVRGEAVKSHAHEMAYPISTYAPWRVEPGFVAAYEQVRRNTLVDIWRCYELWSLLGEIADVPGAIIEVGVWRGGSGCLMAKRATELGFPEPVYLCDTWKGVVKTGAVDTYYRDGKHDDTSKEIVDELVATVGLTNVRTLQGIFPDDTADQVTDDTFRLCHIDVDVYKSAADVLDWVWPKLSTNGLVVFDDYGFPACPGIRQFVDEQKGLDDRLVLHNLNGHGIIVKR